MNQTLQNLRQIRLISQSHPNLILQSFYQDINPYKQLIQLIEHNDHHQQVQTHSESIRRELLFIIIHLLKKAIIPKLKSATVAFDSSQLKQSLICLLDTKSIRLLNELYLNYPNLLHDLQPPIHSTPTNDAKPNQQDPLQSFFSEQEHPIFKIFNYNQQQHPDHQSNQKNTDHHPEFESIINQVFTVLPNLASRQTLRSIIEKSPDFQDTQQGAQRLIERSFSDPQFFIPSPSAQPNPSLTNSTQNRRNIFDDQRMDPNLLRLGKIKLDEKKIMNDKSHLTKEMKDQIKARLEQIEDEERGIEAERQELILYSDDEPEEEEGDDDDGKRKRAREVGDIFSDDDHRFKVGHEDNDLSDPEDPSRPSTPLPIVVPSKSTRARGKAAPEPGGGSDSWKLDEEVLCAFYLDDPTVFLPSARSSKTRLALKNRLRSTKQDDLIEAWKTMFERNPQKEEILERYRLQTALQDPDNRGAGMTMINQGGEGTRGRGERGRGERGRGGGRGSNTRGRGGGRPGPSNLTNPTSLPASAASSSAHPKSTTDTPRGSSSRPQTRTNHAKSLTHRKVRGRDKKLALISGGAAGLS